MNVSKLIYINVYILIVLTNFGNQSEFELTIELWSVLGRRVSWVLQTYHQPEADRVLLQFDRNNSGQSEKR